MLFSSVPFVIDTSREHFENERCRLIRVSGLPLKNSWHSQKEAQLENAALNKFVVTEVCLEMGAKPSSISDLQHNPVLQKFTGDTAIGEEEEFWEDILAFSFQAPYNR